MRKYCWISQLGHYKQNQQETSESGSEYVSIYVEHLIQFFEPHKASKSKAKKLLEELSSIITYANMFYYASSLQTGVLKAETVYFLARKTVYSTLVMHSFLNNCNWSKYLVYTQNSIKSFHYPAEVKVFTQFRLTLSGIVVICRSNMLFQWRRCPNEDIIVYIFDKSV